MKNKIQKNGKEPVIGTNTQQSVEKTQPTNSMTIETPQIEIRQHEALVTIELPLNQIVFNSDNPRIITDDSEISSLVADIAKNGLIHPITVRQKKENGKYQIIAGERRYRACKVLNYEYISCIVKQFDDEQTTDVMMSENLMREPLKPLEEAKKYQTLLWDKQYPIEEIAARFNQPVSHVYNRLVLLNMIAEIADLVNDETISLGVANEICKYSFDIQREVYENHLKKDDSRNWQNLSVKAFKKKLGEHYSTCLEEYNFDKTGCQTCMYNSEFLSMFPSGKSFCKNHSCLQKLQAEYVIKKTIELAKENPHTEINIPPTAHINEETMTQLSQLGVTVLKEYSKNLPQEPKTPQKENYSNVNDYKAALHAFEGQEKQYTRNVSTLEKDIQEGKAKFVIDLEAKEPVVRYVNVAKSTTAKPLSSESSQALIEQLKKQDTRNDEIRKENTNKDLVEFLKKSENPSAPLHEMEDTLFFYILLHRSRHQTQEELKTDINCKAQSSFEICRNLTEEQKNKIIRDVIIDFVTSHPTDVNGLMEKYMELYFPEKLLEVNLHYMDIFNARHKKIEEKLKILIPQKKNKKTKEQQPAKEIAASQEQGEPVNEIIREVDYVDEKQPNDLEKETTFENEMPTPEIDEKRESIEQVDYIKECMPESIITGQQTTSQQVYYN